MKNLEIIVIDDGSTDNTKEIVDSYRNPKIKYIYQKNTERSAARNNGIQNASGKWICFLDSDDIYLSEHLSTLKENISQNEDPKLFITGNLIRSKNSESKHQLIDTSNKTILRRNRKTNLFSLELRLRSIASILKNRFNPKFNIWEDTHLLASNCSSIPNYSN